MKISQNAKVLKWSKYKNMKTATTQNCEKQKQLKLNQSKQKQQNKKAKILQRSKHRTIKTVKMQKCENRQHAQCENGQNAIIFKPSQPSKDEIVIT